MSDNLDQDILLDEELQDELVEDVEVSDEELEEATAPVAKGAGKAEVDGQKAAEDDAATIKKSAPAKATPPKTKAGMVSAMSMKMAKMKKEELSAAYNSMFAEGSEVDEEEIIAENNFEEDLNALADSEATLSEGFKDKASVIFEAALKSKLGEHVERLEEQYAEELQEETDRIQSDLVEKVDGYLNYVVEQWMEDNKLAIESGLRTEIAENFMSQLHSVFTENYIEVPESKVDFVDELATKVEDLEEQLNAKIEDNIKLTESVKVFAKDAIVKESSVGLSEAQAEKLKSLVEDVDFDSVEAFQAKVDTIKESYFKQAKPETIAEDAPVDGDTEEEISVSPRMEAYLKALKIK
jgi:hypothetical protein